MKPEGTGWGRGAGGSRLRAAPVGSRAERKLSGEERSGVDIDKETKGPADPPAPPGKALLFALRRVPCISLTTIPLPLFLDLAFP